MNNSEIRSIPEGCIGVVASSDENYAAPLAVMFFSLLRNCAEPERVRLFCLDGGISDATKNVMQKEIRGAGGEGIDFIQFDASRYAELPTVKHVTASAYYRISIPDLFDDTVGRVLYLDCDMVVKGDIAELWALDIDGYHLGAVENLSGHTHRKLGIPQHEYFNSGMLLINLDLWRRDRIPDEVFRFKVENPERMALNDQCALNGVLHEKWKRLPLKWNHQKGLYHRKKKLSALDPADVGEALLNPGIIHYVTDDKPWNRLRFHPLAGEYDRYADQMTLPRRQRATFADYLVACRSISGIKKLLRRWRWRRWYRNQGYELYPAD